MLRRPTILCNTHIIGIGGKWTYEVFIRVTVPTGSLNIHGKHLLDYGWILILTINVARRLRAMCSVPETEKLPSNMTRL